MGLAKFFFYIAEYQSQLNGTIRQQTNKLNSDSAYRHLLKRVIKSLSTDDVEDLCFISTEANSSGIRNKANFNGIVLFKFFEQRMLITAENLEYLRNHLKNICRIDLCRLIDEYVNTHVSGSSFVQFAEQLPQSSQSKPHPSPTDMGPHPSSSVGTRPIPEYHDQSKYICKPITYMCLYVGCVCLSIVYATNN